VFVGLAYTARKFSGWPFWAWASVDRSLSSAVLATPFLSFTAVATVVGMILFA
jgi:hypothetical protein